ncbi:unnamed protein product [Amoebophrya sp. A25]|nr:unnamed protein product [Amoebophrya sp. A25]|eukprot:GSA25T00019540001.1
MRNFSIPTPLVLSSSRRCLSICAASAGLGTSLSSSSCTTMRSGSAGLGTSSSSSSTMRRKFGTGAGGGATRPTSPEMWLQRQMKDRWVRRAQNENYRTRAAFKLKQMDSKFGIFKRGQIVLDLGCYSGGWSQVAIERTVGEEERSDARFASGDSVEASTRSKVIGVDLLNIDPLDDHTFIKGDVRDSAVLEKVMEATGGLKCDVVMSDMCPSLCGSKQDDHLESMELALAAAEFAERVLIAQNSSNCLSADKVPSNSCKGEENEDTTGSVDGSGGGLRVASSGEEGEGDGQDAESTTTSTYSKTSACPTPEHRRGGWFICKILYGPEASRFKLYLKTRFARVLSFKPHASRDESREMYIVCSGFFGRAKIHEEVQTVPGYMPDKEKYHNMY